MFIFLSSRFPWQEAAKFRTTLSPFEHYISTLWIRVLISVSKGFNSLNAIGIIDGLKEGYCLPSQPLVTLYGKMPRLDERKRTQD
jgi:hypothetical protein